MNYEVIKYLRDDFDRICHVFDIIEVNGLFKNPYPQMTLRDVFQAEVGNYLLYLCASDGTIDRNEVKVYRLVTGFEDTAAQIIEYLTNNQVYTRKFASRVPVSIKAAVEADRRIGHDRKPAEYDLPELLFGFYRRMGMVLIGADGIASPVEVEAIRAYLTYIRKYIDQSKEVGRE